MTTSKLRSRVLFPALESSLKLSRGLSEDEGDEELTYDLYESPCAYRASNEEFLPEHIDEFEVCETTFYGACLEEPPEINGDIVELRIIFDFELWHRKKSSASKTLEHLEAVMLEHVATVVGLKDCDETRQRQRRLQYQHDFTDEQLDLLVGVSSETRDVEDADFDACFIPVSRSTSAGAECQPSTGIMTVYLKNDPALTRNEETSIASGFQRLIRWGMQEDVYVGGNTKHVSFIGTRTGEGDFDSFRQPNPDGLQGLEEGPVGDPNRTAAVIGGLASLVLLVGMILFFIARPKREEHKVDQDFIDAIAEADGSEEKNDDELASPNPWLEKSNQQRPDGVRPDPPCGEVSTGKDPNVSNLSL